MKTLSSRFVFSLLIIFFMATSCNTDVSDGKEGKIIFKLTYLDDENQNPIITFLPTEMTYIFKDGKTKQQVEGWGGVFKMIGISDSKNDSVVALMKLLGDKFLYRCKLGEDSFGYEPWENLTYEYLNEEKLIAGYNCKKAIAHHKEASYELYYTEDIIINQANWNTPFKEIKGVLLEYQIDMFNIKTKIEALEIKNIKIEESEFNIPEGYKNVDKKKIEDTVYKFM